jgi:nucleoid-associated protein YgaU
MIRSHRTMDCRTTTISRSKWRRAIIPSAQAVGSVLVLLLSGVATVSVIAANEELHTARTTTYVVQPGDTLWNIALSVDKQHDTRAVVDEIERLNGMTSADLKPGQVLILPEGDE